jgi:hypothetical protein
MVTDVQRVGLGQKVVQVRTGDCHADGTIGVRGGFCAFQLNVRTDVRHRFATACLNLNIGAVVISIFPLDYEQLACLDGGTEGRFGRFRRIVSALALRQVIERTHAIPQQCICATINAKANAQPQRRPARNRCMTTHNRAKTRRAVRCRL